MHITRGDHNNWKIEKTEKIKNQTEQQPEIFILVL